MSGPWNGPAPDCNPQHIYGNKKCGELPALRGRTRGTSAELLHPGAAQLNPEPVAMASTPGPADAQVASVVMTGRTNASPE